MEIERKFRLEAVPEHAMGTGLEVSQGYLPTTAGELRLRKKGPSCYLTVKGSGTLAREEWETETPDWVFNLLWPSTEGRRVSKVRYRVQYEGLTLEIDRYLGSLQGLVTLECEFVDFLSAERFVLPPWAVLATDITTDPRYKNKTLALKGLPSPL